MSREGEAHKNVLIGFLEYPYIHRADMPEMIKIAGNVPGYAWSEDELVASLSPRFVKGFGLRVLDTKELIAYAALDFDPNQGVECEVPFFLVDPAWRDQGAGEKLRDFLWEKARKYGFENVYVHVKASDHPEDVAANEGYFQSLGFIREKSVEREDGEYYKMAYWGPQV